MCGVAGFKSDEKAPRGWYKRLVKTLICSESRGEHATGVFLWDGDNTILVKQPVSATEFVRTPEFKALKSWQPKVCLAHTRWATQGSATDNGNNHPIDYGRFVLIHNGIISNDAELRVRYNLPKEPAVDSFVIVALINRFNTMYRSVERAINYTHTLLSGSYVCVLFDKETGLVYPFRNTSAWYTEKKDGVVWWASEDDILKGKEKRYRYIYTSSGYDPYNDWYGYTHAGSQYGLHGYGHNRDHNRVIPGAGVHSRYCDCYLCEQEYGPTPIRRDLLPAPELGHTKPLVIEGGFPVRCRTCDQPYYWTPKVQDKCPTCDAAGWTAIHEEEMKCLIETWVDNSHGTNCDCEECTAPDPDIPEMSRAEANEFRRAVAFESDGGTSADVELED